MSENKNDFNFGIWMGVLGSIVVFVILSVFLIVEIRYKTEIEKLEKEAIIRGYAEYYLEENSKSFKWRWKENE